MRKEAKQHVCPWKKLSQCTDQKQKRNFLGICKSVLNEQWPCIYAAAVTVYVVDTFGVSSLIISLSEEQASINSSSVTAPSESLQETNSNKGEVGLLDLLTVISTSKWLYEWVSHWWVPNVLSCWFYCCCCCWWYFCWCCCDLLIYCCCWYYCCCCWCCCDLLMLLWPVHLCEDLLCSAVTIGAKHLVHSLNNPENKKLWIMKINI